MEKLMSASSTLKKLKVMTQLLYII